MNNRISLYQLFADYEIILYNGDKSSRKGEITGVGGKSRNNDRIIQQVYIEYSYKVYEHYLKYISDFNCDGERDIFDATCIQRLVKGEQLQILVQRG